MNLIESLGREALMAALLSPRTTIEWAPEWRDNQSYVVPRPAVLEAPIVEVLRKHLHENKSEERVLALLAIEYLTAHPELLAEQLVKHVIEWATQKTDNWNRPSDGRVAVREAAREAAARLLEKDENFRARVLDMAGLSDSDRIEVKIELKPAGGNAR